QVTTQKIATSKVLAPLRGATQLRIPFPVVSADSDHRLLSLQPFGLRSGESTRRKLQWGFSSPHFAFFRLDESPVGYSLAGCSPAEPASASPTGGYFATMAPRLPTSQALLNRNHLNS